METTISCPISRHQILALRLRVRDLLCRLTTTCQLPPVHYTLASTQFSSATWGTCTFHSPAPLFPRSASPTPCTFTNATYVPDSLANGFLYLLVSKHRYYNWLVSKHRYYNCSTAPTRYLALRSVATTCQTCVSLTTRLYLLAHHHGNYNWHCAYVSMHYGAALTVTTCPAPPPAITVISSVSPTAPSLTTAPA